MSEKLILIDGNSFCYRAYYAIRDLANSKGMPTNAIYGFVTMLNKIIKEENPKYLAVAFDLKGPTFRHAQYKEYKIHRKPMPEGLVEQMPIIKEVLSAQNIRIFEKEGYEADDVLATIAKKAIKKIHLNVFIVTGDKDALQLVDDNIKVYNTHKEGEIFDAESIKKRYNVGPDKVVDIMALMGDATDNIPGVPGIGEKTAVMLMGEFGTLDNIFLNLDRIKSESLKKRLKENEELARLSKKLATIDSSVPIDFDLEELKIKDPDSMKLFKLYKELEFKSLLKTLYVEELDIKKDSAYKLIETKEEFLRFLKSLEKTAEFAFDFETTDPDPIKARPVGVSFCWKAKEAYYISFKDISIDYVLGKLKPIFEDEKIGKVGQNIKYELIILANYGIRLKGIVFDTMLASYLLNPSKMSHSLDEISLEYLGHRMTPIEDLIGKGAKRLRMDEVEVERVSRYSCEDSDVTFRLKERLEKLLFEKELDSLFREVEMPLIGVLADMELYGVAIDTDLLKKMSKRMEDELSDIVLKIYKLADCEFNINSPKQLSEVLFERLKLPVVKRTKTGPSTDVEVLMVLAQIHPLAGELLKYRELTKLKSTYIDALPEMLNPRTNRLHTSFNQTVTATGRLSSSSPNLQNIPIKTEEGRKIRKAFVAEKSFCIMSCDYSQIELRILAHLSKDEELTNAFENEEDVHRHTAQLIFGAAKKDITDQMRQIAKTVNFGIIYGMSPYGLSKDLGIDQEQAREFIDSYFERYPRVRSFIDRQIEEAREIGYVTTLLNRRRYIPQINSQSLRERQFAERTAINTPIQGSAADLIKVAMIKIHNEIKKRGLRSRMILQVHDELVFEVFQKELEEMKAIVRERMEGVFELNVPIKVKIMSGPNWLEMEELK